MQWGGEWRSERSITTEEYIRRIVWGQWTMDTHIDALVAVVVDFQLRVNVRHFTFVAGQLKLPVRVGSPRVQLIIRVQS
jgi:hypothetical protein